MLIPLIALPVVAYVLSARQPAKYSGTATVLFSSLNLAQSLNGLQSDQSLSQQPDRFATTQANIARAPEVAKIAVAQSKLKLTSGQFLAETGVSPESNADLLDFNATNESPALANTLATAYARAFVRYTNLLQTEPLQSALSDVTKRLASLRAAGKTKSSLYTTLALRQTQIVSLQALQTSDTVLVKTSDSATQVAPRPKRSALIGFGLGILIALALLFTAEAVDTRVRTPALIEAALGVPLIGRIPPYTFRGKKTLQPGLSMLGDHGGAQAEAFRTLRTSIAFVGLKQELRSLLVTSARSGDGKTETVANLGIAFARSGRHVIICDLDARRPSLGTLFGPRSSQGVTDVVLGQATLDRALTTIEVGTSTLDVRARLSAYKSAEQYDPPPGADGRLQVLPFGTFRPPDPGALVSSDALQDVLASLRERADLVIIDTAPLLVVGDALELSAEVDGILTVVRATRASRGDLAETRRLLATSPAPTIGFVLTDTSATIGEDYGYGYGFDRGSDSRVAAIATEAFERPAERER